MEKLRKSTESVSRVLFIISEAALALMGVLIVVNILLRQMGFAGIQGTFELVGFISVFVLALSLARNEVTGTNVAVFFIFSNLSKKKQVYIENCIFFISAILYWTIAFSCVATAIYLWKSGEVSMTLSVPFSPFYMILGVGCFFLGLVLWTKFFKSIEGILKK